MCRCVQYCYKHANQYSEVCKIFKGKIGLRLVLDDNKNEVRHHQIITQVKDQLFSLRCGAKSLLGSSKVPHLNLSYCACSNIENFYQVKQLLTNHQIRKLVINNIYGDSDLIFNETIDDDYFDDFPKCPRVKTLSFLLTQLDETHDLIPKITKMVSFFPNLTEIDCFFNAEHYTSEQFSSQKLIDRVAKECKTIEQLRKACPLNTSFDLTHRFRIRRAEPLLTVKQTIKHFLKTTKFNQLHFFKHAVEEIKNDDVMSLRYYYFVIIKWKEQNFKTSLSFEGDLDPLTLGDNEVIEEDDNLVIPLFDRYEPD
ncbi:hypothetical protein M3Y97_01112100 [Aphelenchoides bicaudatus]|nr:hypothetical protein M3Y97_01112100 [Aphelenchoides bicaudatus]